MLCSHERHTQLAVLQRTCSTSNNSFPLDVMNSFRVVFYVERLPKNRQRTKKMALNQRGHPERDESKHSHTCAVAFL